MIRLIQHFRPIPKWYRLPLVRALAGGYFSSLRAILRRGRDRFVLLRCSQCRILFPSALCNKDREDIACPFGCREERKRESLNRRSRKYYQEQKGREKKQDRNRHRSRDLVKPLNTVARKLPISLTLARHFRWILKVNEGRHFTNENVYALVGEILRQRSLDFADFVVHDPPACQYVPP